MIRLIPPWFLAVAVLALVGCPPAGDDDDATAGDDDATAGDDDATAGDDDATAGDDDATPDPEDMDGDGVRVDVDCDDGDPTVFPGQTAWFDEPRANGSWDYDCNGVDEQRWGLGSCGVYPDCGNETEGFMPQGPGSLPPACGVADNLMGECMMSFGGPEPKWYCVDLPPTDPPQIQECR